MSPPEENDSGSKIAEAPHRDGHPAASNRPPHAANTAAGRWVQGRWVQVRPEDLPAGDVPASGCRDEPNDASSSTEQASPTAADATRASQLTESSPEDTAPQESTTPSSASHGTTAAEKPKLELKRRQQLEHHLKSSPTDLAAFLELARIYRAEQRPIEARRVLQQALQIFPDEAELKWEFEEATLARSRQQLREVTDLAHRLDTAETARELKRCQDDWAMRRMEVCRARLARDSSQTQLRVVLAEAMYDAGMYEAAIDELDPVLKHDEFSPTAYLIRGRCLLAMSKDLEAMVALRACALRRAVVAPLRMRIVALRLLCETAERQGLTLTLAQYRGHLHAAEQELAKQSPPASA